METSRDLKVGGPHAGGRRLRERLVAEAATSPQLHFPPFRMDVANACLWRGSRPVHLTPKAFSLLRYLAERPGQLATKEALLDAVWPGTVVCDAVLKVCVREIRKAIGDAPDAPRFLATVHCRGYRFVAPVSESDERPGRRSLAAPGESVPGRGAPVQRPLHLLGGAAALD